MNDMLKRICGQKWNEGKWRSEKQHKKPCNLCSSQSFCTTNLQMRWRGYVKHMTRNQKCVKKRDPGRLKYLQNIKLHIQVQVLNSCLAWRVFSWFFKYLFCLKVKPHTVQAYGLSSEWISLCRNSSPLTLKHLPQVSHAWGFSPVCVVTWASSSWRRRKCFSQ